MKPGQRRAARRRGAGCTRSRPAGSGGEVLGPRPVPAERGGAARGRPGPYAPSGRAAPVQLGEDWARPGPPLYPAPSASAGAAGSRARRGGQPPGRGGGAPLPARPAAAPGGGAGPSRLPALPAAAAGRAARGHGARQRRAERGAPAPCTGAMRAGSPGDRAAAPRPEPRRAR